jgi:glycosyltransferase involved in cell wall biosynthesis
MRVIHVITRLIVGGAQQNTVATVLGLQKKPDIHTTLLAGPTSGPEGSLESAFRHDSQLLTLVPSLVRPVNPPMDMLALKRLTQIFRRARPDIVHTHSGKAGILGRLAARRARVPIIIHTIHGPSFGPFQGKLANAVFLAAERRAGVVTTHFVSVADAMTRQYLAAGIGAPGMYTRIFSGFDLAPFLNASNDPQFRASLGIAPTDFVVGKIARLFHLKGHDDLINAADGILKKHPQTKFLLVGDGILREKLQRRVRDKGVEKNFIFAGLITPAEIPRYIGVMDVLTHLSRREGLARALPQALAARRPVVACDCDGASEVCISGETGFLIAPGDREALTERLTQLAENPALRRQMGERGQDFTRRHFSVETMVDNIYNLYCNLARMRKQ